MGYLRDAWYVAGWVDDIGDAPISVTIIDQPIVLWRADRKLVAFEDRCVHRLAPLSLGRCEGASLRCMYHGFRFGPDGIALEIPGQEVIPPSARVRAFPVVERHSWAWIWMGDPARADESLIPPAVGLDDPDWLLGRGSLDYDAEARLINDNLLDFSHLTYVHPTTLGVSASFSEERPRLVTLDRGVRFERWVLNSRGLNSKSDALLDSWSTYDFLVPGVLLMITASFPAGTASASNFERPDYARAVSGVTFTNQAVTPTGEKTASYFFSWGPHREHGDEATRAMLMELADRAFNEDKTMIEAQQRTIDRTPNPRILPSAHDRGVTIYNSIVKRLMAQEEAD